MIMCFTGKFWAFKVRDLAGSGKRMQQRRAAIGEESLRFTELGAPRRRSRTCSASGLRTPRRTPARWTCTTTRYQAQHLPPRRRARLDHARHSAAGGQRTRSAEASRGAAKAMSCPDKKWGLAPSLRRTGPLLR